MISTFIPGTPVPQGSGKAITSRSTGRPVYVPVGARKIADYRKRVAAAVEKIEAEPHEGAASVFVAYYLPRPKSHLTASGALKPWAPRTHTKRPDVDKLVRATLDALTATGKVWADDSQVVKVVAEKLYAPSLRDVGTLVEVSYFPGGSYAI